MCLWFLFCCWSECTGWKYTEREKCHIKWNYLTGQKFEEASGTITQCNANGIVAEVTYKNNSTANIKIKGNYDLNRGEEIVIRYLPHTDIRMEWYVLDDVTGEPVYLETGADSLIDKELLRNNF